MNAIEVARALGIPEKAAWGYLQDCEEVVESDQYVATLKGPTVHIAASVKGLGGRRLLRECRGTLRRWFDQQDILYAPVKIGNDKAVRLAIALGFYPYAVTPTYVWLMQTKERFNGH